LSSTPACGVASVADARDLLAALVEAVLDRHADIAAATEQARAFLAQPATPAWSATRELRIEQGPVVISQVRTDPGDMGEPRVLESDGVTYVAVPDFDGEWAVAATPVGALDATVLAQAMSVSLDIYGWDLDSMAREIAPEYDRLAAASEPGEP
jgi:hypothetical protein